jgi:hypothetical protein
MASTKIDPGELEALRNRVAELELQLTHGQPRGGPDEDGVTVAAITVQRTPDGLSRLWCVEVPIAIWKRQAYALTAEDVHDITLSRGERQLLALLGVGER